MGDELINGRYRLQEKLGEGGMATVYRALDLHLEREVAIKIMKMSLTGTSKKRVSREFRAVTAVNHPACIKVYEFGETDDFPFFTMEVFRGLTITSLIGQNPALVYSALLQAAEALDDVHQHKIIHRDIKPTNLLVEVSATADGQPQALGMRSDPRLTELDPAIAHQVSWQSVFHRGECAGLARCRTDHAHRWCLAIG